MASASGDKTIRLWDGLTGESVGEPLMGHEISVNTVAFSPDGKLLASGGWDRTVQLWDARAGCRVGSPLREHASVILSLIFSPDGSRLFSAGRDGAIHCWNISSSSFSSVGHELTGHRGRVESITISPDGKRIISGGRDASIRMWDCQDFHSNVDYTFIDCGTRTTEKRPAQIPNDGWIRTVSADELLLWVPSEYRGAVCDMTKLCIAREEDKRSVRIVWDKVCRGEGWTSIF